MQLLPEMDIFFLEDLPAFRPNWQNSNREKEHQLECSFSLFFFRLIRYNIDQFAWDGDGFSDGLAFDAFFDDAVFQCHRDHVII